MIHASRVQPFQHERRSAAGLECQEQIICGFGRPCPSTQVQVMTVAPGEKRGLRRERSRDQGLVRVIECAGKTGEEEMV